MFAVSGLYECVQPQRGHANSTSGQTTLYGASCDLSGWTGVIIFTSFTSINFGAVTHITVQGSHDNSTWHLADGASISVPDDGDDKLYHIELYRPQFRYMRGRITRAAHNSSLGYMMYLKYGERNLPVDPDVDTHVGSTNYHPYVTI